MFMDEYKRWLAQNLEDEALTAELEAIAGDEEAIRERFAIDLAFGTAGLRGVLGAGTNRMNIYTVRRATQGLANYLKQGDGPLAVAIGYDSRINSNLFSREVARVLAANGITAHIYPQLQPVPALSFAVRRLACAAGVMITASHNPAKYNGYKVYGPDGCQMTTEAAAAVTAEIEKLDIFTGVQLTDYDKGAVKGLIKVIPKSVLEAYYAKVLAQRIRPGLLKTSDLKLVYSPLHGAGNVPVRHVLAQAGLANVVVVPQQEKPDGNFPTAPYPNPETHEAMEMGLKLARQHRAHLLLATDPDADRVGIAVRDNAGEYHLLSGNEVGVLLLDYICRGRRENGSLPPHPMAVKSIVSTPMAGVVAAAQGVEMVNVLTGFKYIGEQIAKLEKEGQEKRFIFGFEESYGYLAGTYVRDKDAVVASLLICEMAAWYGSLGSNLYNALNSLYEEYGRYLSRVDNFSFEGLAGMEKMAAIMAALRKNPPAQFGGRRVIARADYESHTVTDTITGNVTLLDLPAADVLVYTLAGGAEVIVRPSGTEPKVKVYYTTRGSTLAEAEGLQQKLAADIAPLMA